MLLQLRLMTESRAATIEEVTAVHDAEYVQQLKDTAENKAPTVVADFDDPDGFTYMTTSSFDDALKVTFVAQPWSLLRAHPAVSDLPLWSCAHSEYRLCIVYRPLVEP